MRATSRVYRSAPERELGRTGSEKSYRFLLEVAKSMSDEELVALEQDMDYYRETGLIGVRMSHMLAQLQESNSATAA